MPAGRRLPLEAFIFSSPSRERSLCPSVALLECPSGVLISRPPGALLFWFWAFFLGGESVKGDLCGLGGDVVCGAGGACVLLVVYYMSYVRWVALGKGRRSVLVVGSMSMTRLSAFSAVSARRLGSFLLLGCFSPPLLSIPRPVGLGLFVYMLCICK